MEQQKYLLITGAFGGLGIALLDLLIEHNYIVFATDIRSAIPENYLQHPQIIPVTMDVREQNSINKAFDQIATITSKLE